VSSAVGVSVRDNYITSTPGLHRHSHTPQLRHKDVARYSSFPEAPRNVLDTTMPVKSTYLSAGMAGYVARHDELSCTLPFDTQYNFGEITYEGYTVLPKIEAIVEKGFFWSEDRVWTCHRRNYFEVSVWYGLIPWLPSALLYWNRGKGESPKQIKSLAVSLSAAIDGTDGKNVELTQHTPKRNRGPQLNMKKEPLGPTPLGKSYEHGANSIHQSGYIAGPSLPLQTEAESLQQYTPTSDASTNYQHTFERIQFRTATSNNKKRLPKQQYYHINVELRANVQNSQDSDPFWVKVAVRSSHPVVVRGRSPIHSQSASRGTSSGISTMGGGFGGNTELLDLGPVGGDLVPPASWLNTHESLPKVTTGT
jgi:meiosis-specific transcription factor NDT80